VSVNLAQAAAAMGQGVLLVDADLRRRPCSYSARFTKRTGTQQRYFYKLAGFRCYPAIAPENLFVLTSGQIPPDPTKLSSKRCRISWSYWQNFDLVIYDTPPLLGLADSCLLANLQLELLVVRMGKTDHSVLMQALDRLKFLAPQS